MSDLLRESIVGQIVHGISRGQLLRYADQHPGWQSPGSLQLSPSSSNGPSPYDSKENALGAGPAQYLVSWYDEKDPDSPQNWSRGKQLIVLSLISLLTFSIYIGSAIYTPSIPGIMERFDVSQTTATLGLSLFIFGYGIGPLILSPLSEIPSIGRNPVYMVTLFLFVILQIPTIYARNFSTIMALRFLAGFVGSPALATGGASIQDIFPFMKLPYVIVVWNVAAVCGPVLGPVVGGFAAQYKNWQWPLFELLWLSSFTFILLLFWLPETSADTILLRRARRLRKATGNKQLFSQSEIKQANMSTYDVLFEALLRPFQLMLEPSVVYVNVYIALAYAIFYLWFEAFPLVYVGIHHFSLGESGLPFLGLMVGCVSASIGYMLWNHLYVEPQFMKTGQFIPEDRLLVALFASAFIPLSLFIFGWTARPDIHWIAPTIGAALYLPGLFLLFQSALVYLQFSYPKYAASVLAGNGLFRAAVAGSFPLFGTAMYNKLSIGGGCSLLAGLSIALVPGLWLLYKYGARLRARSKYASAAM